VIRLEALLKRPAREVPFLIAIWLWSFGAVAASPWPSETAQTRPWVYWWWMGSAVDKTNLARELERYHQAGLGGVHIIPIYGARGSEPKFIDYLSPKWMEMLDFTVREARRLNMGVDMTTGTGWCFGGPRVTEEDANASVVVKTYELNPGSRLQEKISRRTLQVLMAFPPEGRPVDLLDRLDPDGTLTWSPPSGSWKIYAVSQKPSGQKVKRAAPGGEGPMINLFYPPAMGRYLSWFDEAFAAYTGPKPRALYHDSYEYRSDWAPDFFARFETRRGYRLQSELPALFSNRGRNSLEPPGADSERVARVKADYRQTLAEIMSEDSLPLWTTWARRRGFLTRNEAHGSPGNWLDLYALADMPETEMFSKDRNRLVSKFASSAAHVVGKPLVAAETGTWLKDHFTETLADLKYLLDDMFLSGVNHVFYHGTCYSPDEVPWPGWVFYASYEMNPRNSIWHHVPTLNAYVARCQAVLQAGRPDNDLLVYWPIHDVWHNPSGLVESLTIHAREWFEDQPLGKTAGRLWREGFAFDYVSDAQLAAAKATPEAIQVPGGTYRAVLVPPTAHLPVETLRALLALANTGATVLFEDAMPAGVPGWGHLAERRGEFKSLLASLALQPNDGVLNSAKLGKGRVLSGKLESLLREAGLAREPMCEREGLMCVRRAFDGGEYYFIANRSEAAAVNDWVPLGRSLQAALVLDPLTGQTGRAPLRRGSQGQTEVYLSVEPGDSLILRCAEQGVATGPEWRCWLPAGDPVELSGEWKVTFVEGGPELPGSFETAHLASWTELRDTNSQRFAGTALYSRTFDAPTILAEAWQLDLGKVCQSARVKLNGHNLGTLITPPFRVVAGTLRPRDNRLEVEVTNVSANRIRDLDRRGVRWKNFYDINFVGMDYRPFDASKWPLTDSGLLGPVTLRPVRLWKEVGITHAK
jgi:hypothetical protein